jgi:hypothetical protein
MAVFITGGHGHIGSWAAYFLAKEGEQVILYDTNPMVPDHLNEVARNITFIKGDVLDFPRLADVFKIFIILPREYRPASEGWPNFAGSIHLMRSRSNWVPVSLCSAVKPWTSAGPEKSWGLSLNTVLKKV